MEPNRENAKELDQFYTNPKVASRFVDEIDKMYGFDNFTHIIEPSMGEGFIYDFLPEDKRVGLDLEKNHPACLEGDFLEWNPTKSNIHHNPLDLSAPQPKLMFVGNPPFGRNSSLANDFFDHAAKSANVIAFIIPRTWMKHSIQSRIPNGWGLYFNAILPDYSFVYKGEPHKVCCVAQIWSTFDPQPENNIRAEYDWREMEL